MHVIAKRAINEYAMANAQATEALNEWYLKTTAADWSSLADIKSTFNYVDYVGNDRFQYSLGVYPLHWNPRRGRQNRRVISLRAYGAFKLMIAMILEVKNETLYNQAMEEIEVFLAKGSAKLSETELVELQRLSMLVEKYEDVHYPMPVEPATLPEMIKLRMFQQNLKQKDAARLLGVTETRLSEVLTGRRRVNMDLAKRLNEKLRIRAEFILQTA